MKVFFIRMLWILCLGFGLSHSILAHSPLADPAAPHPVLSYWGVDPQTPSCPSTEDCVTLHYGERQIRERINSQREKGLELVRIDVRSQGWSMLYLAAWGHSPDQHEFELGLTWKEFRRRNGQYWAGGYQLLDLSVHEAPPPGRVSAIWRPIPDHQEPASKDIICTDLRMKTLKNNLTWENLPGQKEGPVCLRKRASNSGCREYFLWSFESYTGPTPFDSSSPGRPFFAGIWRCGKEKTRLESFDCPISHHYIRSESIDPAARNGAPPDRLSCKADDSSNRGETANNCLQQGLARVPEDFQPMEFEHFWDNGNEKLAILLREPHTPRPGWLTVPALPDAAACRHDLLDSEPRPYGAEPLSLLDLDWLSSKANTRFESLIGPPSSGRFHMEPVFEAQRRTPFQQEIFRERATLETFRFSGLRSCYTHPAAFPLQDEVTYHSRGPIQSHNHPGLIYDAGTSGPDGE